MLPLHLMTALSLDCIRLPAGDLGYLVTLVSEACATYSRQRHEASLAATTGYCRQRTTAELLAELRQGVGQRDAPTEQQAGGGEA